MNISEWEKSALNRKYQEEKEEKKNKLHAYYL